MELYSVELRSAELRSVEQRSNSNIHSRNTPFWLKKCLKKVLRK